MPIDTSILGSYQPPKQENLFNTLAQFEAIRSAQQQGQMNAMQIQKAQREQEREQQLNALYSQAYNPQTGTIDPQRLTGAMAQGGFGSMIPGAQKGFAEAEAAKTEARRKQVDLSKAQYEAMGKHADEFSRLLRPDMNPDVYIAMLAAKRSDPVLGQIYDSMGQSLQDEIAEVNAARQNGTFPDLINREIMGAKEVSKISRDASALKRAMANAAKAVSPTVSGAADEAVPGTSPQLQAPEVFVQAKNNYDANVVADLAEQGRNDLATQYLDQQLKLAELPGKGVPERVKFLRALMADPKLMAAELGLQKAAAPKNVQNVVTETEFAKGGSKRIMDLVDQAPKAKAAFTKARETLKLLNQGITTGFAAEFRQDIKRMGALFKDQTPDQVVRTDLVKAFLGADVYQMMSAFNLGAKNIDSASEQKFLASVLTGTIDLDEKALKRMTKLRADAFREIIEQYNKKLATGKLDKYMSVTGEELEPIDIPPQVNTDAEFERLRKTMPSGTVFIDPEGQERRLP
jgi:hypothetical protein